MDVVATRGSWNMAAGARFTAARRPASFDDSVLDLSDAGPFDGADGLELQAREPEVVEEPLAAAQQHRDDVELKFVHQTGSEILPGDVGAAPKQTSLPPAACLACTSADSIPSVTKWKVAPPSISRGSRA